MRLLITESVLLPETEQGLGAKILPAKELLVDRTVHDVECVARLKRGVSLSQADAEMNAIQENIDRLNFGFRRSVRFGGSKMGTQGGVGNAGRGFASRRRHPRECFCTFLCAGRFDFGGYSVWPGARTQEFKRGSATAAQEWDSRLQRPRRAQVCEPPTSSCWTASVRFRRSERRNYYGSADDSSNQLHPLLG